MRNRPRRLKDGESGVNQDALIFLERVGRLPKVVIPTRPSLTATRIVAKRPAKKKTQPRKELATLAQMFSETLRFRARKMADDPTDAEAAMCKRLRQAKIKFRSQQVIGWYIADIVIPSKMIILELDGAHHNQDPHRTKDAARTKWLRKFGFRVIRIRNHNAQTAKLTMLERYGHVCRGRCRDATRSANNERDAVLTRQEHALKTAGKFETKLNAAQKLYDRDREQCLVLIREQIVKEWYPHERPPELERYVRPETKRPRRIGVTWSNIDKELDNLMEMSLFYDRT